MAQPLPGQALYKLRVMKKRDANLVDFSTMGSPLCSQGSEPRERSEIQGGGRQTQKEGGRNWKREREAEEVTKGRKQ
jgi:hypothetical protein